MSNNPETPRRPRTVLVVDPDDAMLICVGRALWEAGYDVVMAKSGLDALRTVESSGAMRVDLIIAAIGIPDLSGPELAGRLAQWYPARPPVLVITGFPVKPEDVQGPVLQKPFTAEVLSAKAGTLLGD